MLKGQGSSDITCGTGGEQTAVSVTKKPSSSKPRQRNRKKTGRGFSPSPTGLDTNDTQMEGTSREPQMQTSSGGTQATQAESGDSEMIEKDAAQPEVDSQPLPAGKSKSLRPRARPLKRAKAQARVTSDSPPQPQNMVEIQPASGAATDGTVEPVRASPPTLEVENETSHTDTSQLSHKRPSPTSRQQSNANKRQKILDQVQSKAAETANCSTDVNVAAEGNNILMAFQRLANKTY